MLRSTIALLLLAGGVLHAADSPSAAVSAFLDTLKNGNTTVADNPTMVVSPFCPDEKKEKFSEALRELAGQLEGATAQVEEVTAPREIFAGYRLVLRQKKNPLQVQVRPICLLRSEQGWKVAAGLSHFDNTNFGFDPALRALSSEVAESVRRDAQETGQRLLSQGAEALWKEIRDRRAAWSATDDPDALIRRFLEFDRKQDAVGKLACFHVTPDLPPANLERFLTLLAEESFASDHHPDEDSSSNEPSDTPGDHPPERIFPLALSLDGKSEGTNDAEKVCRVFGFIQPEDPSDYYSLAFYLRRGEGRRWLIIPNGYDVEGLRSPDHDLVEWFEENEMRFTKMLVQKLARDGSEASPAPTGRADGAKVVDRYLDALARRALPEVLSLLTLPDDDAVDDFDGLLEEIGKECQRLAPIRGPAPEIIPLRWKEEGDWGGAVHAIYQPASSKPFHLHVQLTRWTPTGWKILPPPWDGAPASANTAHDPGARKAQALLEEEWDSLKQTAVKRLFGNRESGISGQDSPEDTASAAFAAAARGDFKAFLLSWELPGEKLDAVAALEMATRLGWEIRQSGKAPTPEGTRTHGNLAGIILPMDQAKREDGQSPARMLLLRRQADQWSFFPGLELFRPVNRGFRELNAQALREAKTLFAPEDQPHLEDLRSWIEQSSPP